MRRRFHALGAILALTMALPLTMPAMADSPHFISADASGPDAGGALAVSFKLAGLGDTVTTVVTARAQATALYACQNNGGNFPSDPKKQLEAGPISASGAFTSGKNGHVVGTLAMGPLPSTLSCPPGQHHVLVSVSYQDVSVSAPGADTESLPGVFSRVFVDL